MILVVAGVIEHNGRVLIARRRKGDVLGGKWEFPGGKVRPGESPEESLARELEEELGIKVRVGEYICSSRFDYPHASIELVAYRVSFLSGRIRLADHDKVVWVRPEEMNDYDFSEADRPIVNKIIKASKA